MKYDSPLFRQGTLIMRKIFYSLLLLLIAANAFASSSTPQPGSITFTGLAAPVSGNTATLNCQKKLIQVVKHGHDIQPATTLIATPFSISIPYNSTNKTYNLDLQTLYNSPSTPVTPTSVIASFVTCNLPDPANPLTNAGVLNISQLTTIYSKSNKANYWVSMVDAKDATDEIYTVTATPDPKSYHNTDYNLNNYQHYILSFAEKTASNIIFANIPAASKNIMLTCDSAEPFNATPNPQAQALFDIRLLGAKSTAYNRCVVTDDQQNTYGAFPFTGIGATCQHAGNTAWCGLMGTIAPNLNSDFAITSATIPSDCTAGANCYQWTVGVNDIAGNVTVAGLPVNSKTLTVTCDGNSSYSLSAPITNGQANFNLRQLHNTKQTDVTQATSFASCVLNDDQGNRFGSFPLNNIGYGSCQKNSNNAWCAEIPNSTPPQGSAYAISQPVKTPACSGDACYQWNFTIAQEQDGAINISGYQSIDAPVHLICGVTQINGFVSGNVTSFSMEVIHDSQNPDHSQAVNVTCGLLNIMGGGLGSFTLNNLAPVAIGTGVKQWYGQVTNVQSPMVNPQGSVCQASTQLCNQWALTTTR